tara:strand:- start:341 stop:1156 length:816 start_codon:yes stop_codon:yes gene_type:complete
MNGGWIGLFLLMLVVGCGGPKTSPERPPVVFPPPHPSSTNTVASQAEAGDAHAQYQLGAQLDNGRNAIEAAMWFKRAAEQGHREAQFNFACMLAEGHGVEVNAIEAAKWFSKAADQGLAAAQFNLGVIHEEGRGLDKSGIEAVKHFQQSADQGYAPAQFKLANCLLRGTGVVKDEVEAVRYLVPAARQGFLEAQYYLGFLMARGRGVTKDPVNALVWLNLAAAKGHVAARKEKASVAAQLSPADVGKAQRLALQFKKQDKAMPPPRPAPNN